MTENFSLNSTTEKEKKSVFDRPGTIGELYDLLMFENDEISIDEIEILACSLT